MRFFTKDEIEAGGTRVSHVEMWVETSAEERKQMAEALDCAKEPLFPPEGAKWRILRRVLDQL